MADKNVNHTLVEVCPPLGERWPNVGRAPGGTCVDNLKNCPDAVTTSRGWHVGTTLGRF